MKMQYPVRTASVLVVLFALAACAPMPLGKGSKDDPYKITINFADENSCTITGVTEDPTSCVGGGSGFCIGKSEWVHWESNPARIRYKVYFDPIQGQPLRSDGNGILNKKIDQYAPWVMYKYSILRDDCDRETDAYDPHIRVDR